MLIDELRESIDNTPTLLRRREERVALELHRAVARELLTQESAVRKRALQNLSVLRRGVRSEYAQGWLDEWESLLNAPLQDLVSGMLRQDERGIDLRQVGPFLGVLTQQQRLAAIEVAAHGYPLTA